MIPPLKPHRLGPLRTRWAPSPTGQLHLGHIYHSLAVWGAAHKYGAEILIRFEDHDRQRCKDDYLAAGWRVLEQLGFLRHGALVNPDPPFYRQSEQEERYRAAFAALHEEGKVYACSCSRKDLKGLSRYPGTCRQKGLAIELGPPHPYGLRVRLPEGGREAYTDLSEGRQEGNPHDQHGDFVIRDRNGNWSYQFCVVVDDNVDGINLIVRGMDLKDSSLWQQSLERLLTGTVRDKLHWHHPLLAGPEGEKLGKRIKSTPVSQWLAEGYRPEQLIAAALQGVEPSSLGEMPLAQISLGDWLAQQTAE